MTINVTEVKRRLQVLLNDQNLVNEYIRLYGPNIDIKNIKTIKEKKTHNTSDSERSPDVEHDPIYEINVKCPVCNQVNISCYELRAKSLQVLLNKFLVPTYQGTSGFDTVDYNLLAVTVCPRCLFASPDKKDFSRIDANGHSEIKSQLGHSILLSLQEKIGERKAVLGPVTDYQKHFKRPRSTDSSIDSYKLAISRAKIEAWYEQPYALYKIAAYNLKIAKIMKDNNIDNRDQICEALNYFEEAFRTSNCPSEEIEMQVIYTIVALCIKIGEFKKANSFLAVFTNLKNARAAEMRENPKLNSIAIEKWESRAKILWEDRECPDIFKNE